MPPIVPTVSCNPPVLITKSLSIPFPRYAVFSYRPRFNQQGKTENITPGLILLTLVLLISAMLASPPAHAEIRDSASASPSEATSSAATDEKHQRVGTYSGAKTAQHPDWFKESFLDLEEDVADAADQGKRLVVYFWQEGCPYCSQLWEDNFSQKEIEDKFRKHFDIVAINLWGDREVVNIGGANYSEKSFGEALGIQYTPTLLFFDENRKVVLQLNGFIPPRNFRLALDYAARPEEGTKPVARTFAEYVAEKTADEQDEADKNASALLNSGAGYMRASADGYDLERTQNRGEKKYLAVFFERPYCHNCDLVHQKALQKPLTRQLLERFDVVQLDRTSDTPVITPTGDKTTARQWADQLNVKYLPGIVFFDPKGKEVMRIDAQVRSFHIQSVFDYVQSGAYKTQKNFQRYISARAEKLREEGIDIDIFAW